MSERNFGVNSRIARVTERSPAGMPAGGFLVAIADQLVEVALLRFSQRLQPEVIENDFV
jgi:hypothetical protein